MKSTTEIIDFLKQILIEKESERMKHIVSFQNEILNDETIKDEPLNEILSELAYDLDFYEPNENWRKEDISFYSEQRLEELIMEGIKKIENYANDTIEAVQRNFKVPSQTPASPLPDQPVS